MADDFLDLEGRVAIVTGGGRGIGRAYCKAFAEHGAIPVIADLTEQEDQQVDQPDRGGHRELAFRCHVG